MSALITEQGTNAIPQCDFVYAYCQLWGIRSPVLSYDTHFNGTNNAPIFIRVCPHDALFILEFHELSHVCTWN